MTFASGDHHRVHDSTNLARCVAAIREAAALCEPLGTRLIVAFVPTKLRIYGDLCRFPAGSAIVTATADELPGRLKTAVNSIPGKIEFLDLTPTFRDRAARGDLTYFPDDTHWSAEGHARAAEAIARIIARGFGDASSAERPPATTRR